MAITLYGSKQNIIQVVQTLQPASSFSVASTSYTDVTGMSVNITPSSASNKILVMVSGGQFGLYANASYSSQYNICRNGTQIIENLGSVRDSGNQNAPATLTYMDSPATTSSITYKIQAKTSGGQSCQIYSSTDGMTIIVMEVAFS